MYIITKSIVGAFHTKGLCPDGIALEMFLYLELILA